MLERTQQDAPARTLHQHLARLVDERGHWQREAVEQLGPEVWQEWFAARFEGRDPFFPYYRDEEWGRSSTLFHELFRVLKDLDTSAAAAGLARYLYRLDPETCSGVLLRQALDLVMAVRARNTDARDALRDVLRTWIQDEMLLDRPEDEEAPESLHRAALFALVVLQRQGDEADRDVWGTWLDDERFAEAAFSGMALSISDFPEGMLTDFLDLVDRADRQILPRHALEALFVGERDRDTVRRYVWEEVQRRADPEADWERLRTLLRRVAELPPYDVMQRRMRRNGAGTLPGTTFGGRLWEADFSAIQETTPSEPVLA